MLAKDFCEICGKFGSFSFTDCGKICRKCFYDEQMTHAYNQGLEKAIKCLEEKEFIKSLKNPTVFITPYGKEERRPYSLEEQLCLFSSKILKQRKKDHRKNDTKNDTGKSDVY